MRRKGPSDKKRIHVWKRVIQGSAVVELAVALLAIVSVFTLVSEGQKAFKLYEDMEAMTQTAARFASTLSPASTSQIEAQTKTFINDYYLGRGSLSPYKSGITVKVEQLGVGGVLDMAPQYKLSPGDIMKVTSKIMMNGNNQFKSKIVQGSQLERSVIFTYMKNEVGETVTGDPLPTCCWCDVGGIYTCDIICCPEPIL